MTFKILIRHNATGEIRECGPDDYDNLGQCLYQWSEGNYSCDCNRAHFFFGAHAESKCGDGAYSVRVLGPNGNEIYSEFGDAHAQ